MNKSTLAKVGAIAVLGGTAAVSALGVGAVKYESYDKKGRMTLNRELYSIE